MIGFQPARGIRMINDAHIILAAKEMFYYACAGVLIVTVPVLFTGLIISIFQAATQLNEMTLSYVPKFIVMFFVLATMMPWLMHQLEYFMQNCLTNVLFYIR